MENGLNNSNPERGKMSPEQLRQRPYDCMVSHEEMKKMPGKEEIDRRTRGSKIFSLGRGLYQAVLYPEPVHAQKKDGSWVEINNTLNEKQDDRGFFITNQENPQMKVVFRPTPENEMVRLENEKGQAVAWSLENAQPVRPVIVPCPCPEHEEDDRRRDVLDHLDAEVMYQEIRPGVDLRCRIRSASFKDEWIFSDREAASSLSLLLFIPGMVPLLQKNNEIHLVSPDGDTPFIFPVPFMKDAGENNVGAVSVALDPCQDAKDMWKITYTPDKSWLETAAFPVILDPAVVTRDAASNIEDNFVTSAQPNTVQNYAATGMTISKGSSSWGTSKAFIKFLTAGLPQIDSSYYVTKAILTVKTRTAPTTAASIF